MILERFKSNDLNQTTLFKQLCVLNSVILLLQSVQGEARQLNPSACYSRIPARRSEITEY